MYPTHLKNNKHQFLYNIYVPPIQQDNNTDNKHIEIPSATTHIVYQHPQNQHQQLQLISIMNQSAPSSLSEIKSKSNTTNK